MRQLFYTLSVALLFAHDSHGQIDCENFIIRYKTALAHFIPDPGSNELRSRYLESVQHINPGLYAKVTKLALEARENIKNNREWQNCFATKYLEVMPQANDISLLQWSSFLFNLFAESEFLSPEFERGLGIHVDINQGVTDIGQNSEGYSFAARVLLAYTFSNSDNGQGGRWRILGGISTYYQDTRFLGFFNPRIEYRIKDIGNKLTTLGNLKAIVDANFGRTVVVGGGLGLEFHNFGLQLLYQQQGRYKDNHILLGLFYRFRN